MDHVRVELTSSLRVPSSRLEELGEACSASQHSFEMVAAECGEVHQISSSKALHNVTTHVYSANIL